jgi:long-subunit acyl-CoA synthetase (AMP-forming)
MSGLCFLPRHAKSVSWFTFAAGGIPGSNMGGHVVLTGRAKDTIVLSNGENVEPQPVEDIIQCSTFIKYAMVVGQDHRQLGALIVEDADAFAELAEAKGAGPARTTWGKEWRLLYPNMIFLLLVIFNVWGCTAAV